MKAPFNLHRLEGAWESICLHPTVVVYRHYSRAFHLMIIFMNEHTHQAEPSIYEIKTDENGYYIGLSVNHRRLTFDPVTDTLCLSDLGDYMRN